MALHDICYLLCGVRNSVSCENFYRQLEEEIHRLDDLFNGLPARHRARIEDPLPETPGLAIIASRTTALRREYLAGIAISTAKPTLGLKTRRLRAEDWRSVSRVARLISSLASEWEHNAARPRPTARLPGQTATPTTASLSRNRKQVTPPADPTNSGKLKRG